MNSAQAMEYRKKYQTANQFTCHETLEMTPDEKLGQLAIMVFACLSFGWDERMSAGEEEVRQRWLRLTKKHV